MARTRLALAALAGVLVCGLVAFALGQRAGPRPALGLVTSLPIYWSEAAAPAAVLQGGDAPHWVRRQIERSYRLVPLDTLAAPGTANVGAGLARLDRVLLAQPPALAPADLVALDQWIRAGGRALLFLDPMLTEQTRYALGDRRGPQPVATLDPLLAHWGLALQFDPAQPPGRRPGGMIGDGVPPAAGGSAPVALPVELRGQFALHGGNRACVLEAAGIVAVCRLGAGSAVVVADAAMLDRDHPDQAAHAALAVLIRRSFGNPVPRPQ